MLSTRRSFLSKTTRSLGGIVAATMMPKIGHAQHWANCHSGKQVVPFAQANATTKIATFSDWHEGDCEMQGASITLHRDGTGLFHSQVCTHFTHSKDIWHFYVELAADANAPVFLTEYTWNGPQMSEQDHPLFHDWPVSFRLPGGTFDQIKFARATSCC
jgi:hypothetical protein